MIYAKPICPYCPDGIEMIRMMDGWAGVTGITTHYYMCPMCKTTSPKRRSEELALDAAVTRFNPPNEPVTIDELQSGKYNDYPVWIQPRKSGTLPSIMPAIFVNTYDGIIYYDRFGKYVSRDEKEYGKLFVFWIDEPTDDEQTSVVWK